MNKTKGNMYEFISHTWNPIKGRCSHACDYCYMRKIWDRMPDDSLWFDDETTHLGSNNYIFVGSSTDMWADNVPSKWIRIVLDRCSMAWMNAYLFQTKNPKRYLEFINDIPEHSVLGTTIESNRPYKVSKAPRPSERISAMIDLQDYDFQRMITIEPILDFDLDKLIRMIRLANPHWVNIGADSKRSNLPEPSYEKIQELISELTKFTEVRQKKNLKRLTKIVT